MILECSALGWCGFGFGEGMKGADFIVFRGGGRGGVKVEEYSSNGRGVQPVSSTNWVLALVVIIADIHNFSSHNATQLPISLRVTLPWCPVLR